MDAFNNNPSSGDMIKKLTPDSKELLSLEESSECSCEDHSCETCSCQKRIEDISGRSIEPGEFIFILLPEIAMDFVSKNSNESCLLHLGGLISSEDSLEDFSAPKISSGVLIGIDGTEVIAKLLDDKLGTELNETIVIVPSFCVAKCDQSEDMDHIIDVLNYDIKNWNMLREAALMDSMLR